MQLGVVLVLAAIAAGMTSALLEERRPVLSWGYMALCGLLLMAGADDIAEHPEAILRQWGAGVAHMIILFLELASIVVGAACAWWVIKGIWSRMHH